MIEFNGLSNPDYDLCLSVKSPEEGNDLPTIRGQFCWLDSQQGLVQLFRKPAGQKWK